MGGLSCGRGGAWFWGPPWQRGERQVRWFRKADCSPKPKTNLLVIEKVASIASELPVSRGVQVESGQDAGEGILSPPMFVVPGGQVFQNSTWPHSLPFWILKLLKQPLQGCRFSKIWGTHLNSCRNICVIRFPPFQTWQAFIEEIVPFAEWSHLLFRFLQIT